MLEILLSLTLLSLLSFMFVRTQLMLSTLSFRAQIVQNIWREMDGVAELAGILNVNMLLEDLHQKGHFSLYQNQNLSAVYGALRSFACAVRTDSDCFVLYF